jgi:hypothetical protein
MSPGLSQAPALAGRRSRSSTAPRPVPKGIPDDGHHYSLAQRIQCHTLAAEGFTQEHIELKTGIPPRAQAWIVKRAKDRGFRPDEDPRIVERYCQDGERSGRPQTITLEKEGEVLVNVRKDRTGREQSSKVLVYKAESKFSSSHLLG